MVNYLDGRKQIIRKNEFDEVLESYKDLGLNVKGVDAKDRFYSALNGLTDPEEKRKAIGHVFIDVFGGFFIWATLRGSVRHLWHFGSLCLLLDSEG